MRFAWFAIGVLGCGFHHGVSGDSSLVDGASIDAPPDAPPDADRTAPVFQLGGARWLLPCLAGTNGTPNSHACHCADGVVSTTVVLGETSAEQFHVTAHVVGVMEHMAYIGGTAGTASGWYIGGAPGNGGDNFYRLHVDQPDQTFFINAGTGAQDNSWVFDETVTFDVRGDATLTFDASGQDQIQWEGVDGSDAPLSAPGVTDPPQPYNGQFARLDVTDVVAF